MTTNAPSARPFAASHCSSTAGATHTTTSQSGSAPGFAASPSRSACGPRALAAPALQPTKTTVLPAAARAFSSSAANLAFASWTNASDLAEPSPRALVLAKGGKSTSQPADSSLSKAARTPRTALWYIAS
eukprot:CAMPEP_0172628578 /NCGR_PEP_ID=MMETSP1068-20121228/162704_1 /TAXON_ID=35684 /ORGANISM="Pseudopedinella elastica, Strain CCMP716" /LENGTH=129 /DNA_ID=CAMNT_0013438839 /DNA_START=354 /DNA_END=743 /DNA_ORIENTATION=+